MTDQSFYCGENSSVDAYNMVPGPSGRHILVCIDRSKNSWNAYDFCIQNISKPEDLITIFMALDPRDLYKSDNDQEHYRAQTMIEVFEEAKKTSNCHLRVHAVYATDARPAIMDKISLEHGIKYSMVCVGCRGMSSLNGVLLGSVSNYLLNHCQIPVIVTRTQ